MTAPPRGFARAAARLRSLTIEHPFQAVGIGLFAGYVLGGGLITRTTLRLVGVGLRVAALPLLQQKLSDAINNSPQFTPKA